MAEWQQKHRIKFYHKNGETKNLKKLSLSLESTDVVTAYHYPERLYQNDAHEEAQAHSKTIRKEFREAQ